MKYTKQILLAFSGGIVLTVPYLLILPSQMGIHIADARLKAEAQIAKAQTSQEEEVEQYRITQKRKTLKVASEAGEHVNYLSLKLENYTDSHINPNPPTDRYKATDDVHVTDRNGACVGRIRNGRWEWKRWFLNACSN